MGVSKWPKMPKKAILVILAPSNSAKTLTIGKMLHDVVRALHKLARNRFENEFGLRVQKK